MKRVLAFLRSVLADPIEPRHIRSERYLLGGRHQGDVVGGAKTELRAAGITWRRTLLLRAVIASHGR